MRTDLTETVTDEELLAALTGTMVVITAGEDVVCTHSGQSAITTAAILMARSGHQVYLDIPDVPVMGAQPPLISGDSLVSALLECGADLLPGRYFHVGRPEGEVDLSVALGQCMTAPAAQVIALNATDSGARLSETASAWSAGDWPTGALAAAALAAGEAFKAAMRKLRHHAATALFDDWYAPCAEAVIELAPPGAIAGANLGVFDLISGGAIANAALFALLRLPAVKGDCRVLDDDVSAISNLNRNALLRRSRLEIPKVENLASYGNSLRVEGIPVRYGSSTGVKLTDTVLVGVDHIPSRWTVQRTGAEWVGVGATDLFMVQVSNHIPGGPCAGCAYPYGNDPSGDIPTVAFVSFWSGLLLAVELIHHRSGEPAQSPAQQRFFCALRPESFGASRFPLAFHEACPLQCPKDEAA
ncbi:MAG: hypothetical protein V4502_07545 [Pseudomonadota bacterium]